ncbi:MAG: cyclophilin-like fold protein [Spirochaetales bacterium]|nr:cyclophilin-like fold protein [Spirochaetales bacterium]
MRKLISYILTILLLSTTACANGSKGTKTSNKGELSDMKISIQITSDSGKSELTATLVDNSSAMAFYELLEKGSVTIKMTDYGNFEKVGPLGTKLPRNDTQITTQAGDIILYQGNQITIYYDTNSWNFTRLGKIDGVTQAELKKILGKGDVTAVFSVME